MRRRCARCRTPFSRRILAGTGAGFIWCPHRAPGARARVPRRSGRARAWRRLRRRRAGLGCGSSDEHARLLRPRCGGILGAAARRRERGEAAFPGGAPHAGGVARRRTCVPRVSGRRRAGERAAGCGKRVALALAARRVLPERGARRGHACDCRADDWLRPRAWGPGDHVDPRPSYAPEVTILWPAANRGKKSVVLDVHADRERLRRCRYGDVPVNCTAACLARSAPTPRTARIYPRLIVARFDAGGPKDGAGHLAGYNGYDDRVQAATGIWRVSAAG